MTLETIIVAAEFFSGHVKVMLVRSEDEMKSVYSPVPINDDQPHKVHKKKLQFLITTNNILDSYSS